MKTGITTRLFYVLLCVSLFSALTSPMAFIKQPVDLYSIPMQNTQLLQFTSGGHILGFSSKGMYAATGSHALHVDFVGADLVQPQAEASAISSISLGGITAALSRVQYPNLWPGISLTYDTTPGGLSRSTYQLEAGADVSAIRLAYNAPLSVNGDGSLSIAFKTGVLNESAPLAWQVIGGKQVPVVVRFVQHDNEVGFALGQYDAHFPLTIDPTLSWNTFLGGNGLDLGNAIAVDNSGNVYVAGTSYATWGWPVSVRPFSGYIDAFVAKLNSNGALQWNTFLGSSSGIDEGNAISLDENGNVYVSGTSGATWGSPMRAYSEGTYDAFTAKLNTSGVLQWNTFLGGDSEDNSNAIVVYGSGNVYVAGTSNATWGIPVRPYNVIDAFVAKLDANGNLVWNTFLGGSGREYSYAVAKDGSGNIYVAGGSFFTWGAPVREHDPGATYDAFIAKLDASGNLVWNTFLGGSGWEDYGNAITIDNNGNVYVAGNSSATWGVPVRPYSGGNFDAFVAKLDTSGNLIWNTFLGGSEYDQGLGIVVDESGIINVTGNSYAAWGAPARAYSGNWDVFLAKLGTASGSLVWSTFLGGSGSDYDGVIAADESGNLYVAGSSDATWGTPVGPYTRDTDAFIAKIEVGAPSGKIPIVFVHGFLGFPPKLFGCTDTKYQPISLEEAKNYFEGAGDRLINDGGYSDSEIFYARLVSSPCYTSSLVDNVSRLKDAIDQAKVATGQSKVILIAHSMGGLVARAYIEGPNYQGDVETLFMFGSPNLGAPEDVIAFLSNGLTFGYVCENIQPAACDFSMLGMKLFNQSHHKNNAVTYHVISGDAPLDTRNVIGKITGTLIPGGDDGIVPTTSGRATSLGTFDRWTTDEVHVPRFGSRTYFSRDGGASTSYIDCIKKVLVDGASNCGNVNTASPTQQNVSTALAQHTPFQNGLLLSGQTATHSLSLEGGPTLFASQWVSGTLAFTLVDPNGQTIDPAYAIANPGIAAYTENANAATYYFPNATAGTWQLVLQAVSAPAEGASFTTFAAFDSTVTLTGSLDQQWYLPGATATITATLGGLPSSATVTAAVTRTDGITDTLALLPIGNEQYQASYTVPNVPGYAEVRLAVTGTTANSQPFEQGTSLTFQISPDTFTLNNTYTDTAVPYPGLSRYQFLDITVGINANVSGKVGLSADLVDGNGNFVAHALTLQDVAAGTPTLTLQFIGTDIFTSKHDGPYTLTNVLLTDENGSTLVTQQTNAVYTTASYLYSDFIATTNVQVFIAGTSRGSYNLTSGGSTRESYALVNGGPVKVSTTGTPILAAERVLYYGTGASPTSFVEMMGLPDGQLDKIYWFPWYKNDGIVDTQIRIGNVSASTATVHIYVAGMEVTGSPFTLTTSGAGQSQRLSFALNDGPVKIVSDQNIVATERLIYFNGGVPVSFSEMLGLPNSQLSNTYWFPWYKNAGEVDTQLRIGNVSPSDATVHIYIAGVEVAGSPFTLTASGAGQSQRLSFPINNGPVKIVSDVNIVAAQRILYYAGGVPTSFVETMGIPDSQLGTTHWFPWYKNDGIVDTQLRIGNVSGLAASVHVYIGTAEMAGSPFALTATGAGQSLRLSFTANDGPVKIVSDQNIVTSERLIYFNSGTPVSFSEMMGLPDSQLSNTYWLPWYKNVGEIDTQLRFGVP